jgi:hypothetical protein
MLVVATHSEPAVPADAWITLTDNGPSAICHHTSLIAVLRQPTHLTLVL